MSAKKVAEEILAECVAGRTLQIARIVTAQYEKALSSSGVTPHQLTLLSMICKMGAPSAREMLPFLSMDQSTLSRNLERMVAKGWLEPQASDSDARVRCYSLSKSGEQTLVSAHAPWQEAQAWSAQAFGAGHLDDIKSIANRLNPLLPNKPDKN